MDCQYCQDLYCGFSENDEFNFSKVFQSAIPIFLAFIAGFVALMQVKANIISSARIRWIEDLKQSLSQMHADALNAKNANDKNIKYEKSSKDEEKKMAHEFYLKYLDFLTSYNIHSNKVILNLNRGEKLHDAIIGKLKEVDVLLEGDNIINCSIKDIEKILIEIRELAKPMLKLEWDKSKKIFEI